MKTKAVKRSKKSAVPRKATKSKTKPKSTKKVSQARPVSSVVAKKRIAPVAKLTKVVENVTKPSPPIEAPQPTRPPRRMILGAGGVTSIVQPSATNSLPVQAGNLAIAELPQEQKVITPVLVEVLNIEKYTWNHLPPAIPAHIRYLLSNAAGECERATAWPFAFAKLIALLPQEVCGVGFAFLILSIDNDISQISKITGFEVNKVSAYIESARNVLEDKFSSLCGEIYRKWTAQLVGGSKEIDGIIEHYLVGKIDRNLQIMIGEVLLKVLGASNPIVDGRVLRSQWTLKNREVNH